MRTLGSVASVMLATFCVAGVAEADVIVMSGEPFEEQPFAHRDSATWLWYIACFGGHGDSPRVVIAPVLPGFSRSAESVHRPNGAELAHPTVTLGHPRPSPPAGTRAAPSPESDAR